MGRPRGAQARRPARRCTSRRSTAAPAPTASRTAIVVEEVARVCASSSLIPAGNKLGTMRADPVRLRGAQAGAPARRSPPARRRSRTRCPSARPARDAAAMRTRAVRDGDAYVLNGTKCWITGAGVSTHYTVMAVTDPAKGANGHLARSSCTRTTPASRSAPRSASSASRARRPARSTSRTAASRPTGSIGARGHRLQDGADDPGPHPARRSARRRSASRRARSTRRSPTSRSASSSASAIADFQGVQFMLADMAMKIEAARQLVYVAAAKAERGDPDLTFLSSRGQDVRLRHGDGGHHRRGAAVRRLRLHPATSRSSG